MRPVTLLSVACSAIPHFTILSQKGHVFGEKVIEYKINFYFHYKFSLKYLSYLEEFKEILS